MDPITQGALGAAFSQIPTSQKIPKKSWFIGALAGMAPDLDIFIKSSSEPLLSIYYHRHFTHSIFFAPIGGFLIALIFFLFFKSWRKDWKWVLFAAILGWFSHGLLDACTTYGTLLYWPVTSQRVFWDNLPIIDLFFTLPLVFGVIFTRIKKKKSYVTLAFLYCLSYAFLGYQQNQRGLQIQHQLASERSDQIENGRVLPTLFNIKVWKSLYRTKDGFLQTDKIILPFLGKPKIIRGERKQAFLVKKFFNENLPHFKKTYPWIKWYNEFSDGFLIMLDSKKLIIGDMRYSMDPEKLEPLWGLSFQNDQIKILRFTRTTGQERKKALMQLQKDLLE